MGPTPPPGSYSRQQSGPRPVPEQRGGDRRRPGRYEFRPDAQHPDVVGLWWHGPEPPSSKVTNFGRDALPLLAAALATYLRAQTDGEPPTERTEPV